MPNETAGNHPITAIPLFPWNRRDLTSLVDEKGRYLGMSDTDFNETGTSGDGMKDDELTIETALDQADGHAARINAAQTSPAFPVDFDDPDEEDEDDEED